MFSFPVLISGFGIFRFGPSGISSLGIYSLCHQIIYSLGVYSLGVYSLGVYNLVQRDLDQIMHSLV